MSSLPELGTYVCVQALIMQRPVCTKAYVILCVRDGPVGLQSCQIFPT